MPTYVRRVKIEVEFDGQTVTGFLLPLTLADALSLRGFKAEDSVVHYATLLPRYVQSLSSILDANGEVVPMEEVYAQAFYAPLIATIMRQHIDAARPTDPT